MKSLLLAVILVGTNALAQAPSQAPAPPAAPGAAAAAGAPTDANGLSTEAEDALFNGIMDSFDYAPGGARDPFVQPIPDKPVEQQQVHGPLLPLQRFDLNQLSLVGIIWDVKHPKAMIKDPSGQTHVVSTNTKVGPHNGYIAVIREGEIVVVETTEQEGKLVSSAQVVKIAH